MIVFRDDFLHFIENITEDYEVYAPVKEKDSDIATLTRWNGLEDGLPVLDSYRCVDPPKTVLFPARNDVLKPSTTKKILLGIKNCDLQAIKLLDRALLNNDYVDPVYRETRENTLIIGADCTDFATACHCVLQGNEPYPQKPYDISLSMISDRMILSHGSKKGEKFLKLVKKNVETSKENESILNTLNNKRADLRRRLEILNNQWSQSISKEKLNLNKKDLVDSCIECGGCNFICPTCYCFLMNDESTDKKHYLVRTWDGCQLKGYARVAGGANARENLYQRFNHRYACKFKYIPEQFDISGCTGCGRCIDVCPAQIDIRDVMRSMREQAVEK
ncbi:MAG: 4Fe-4S dicluster domain-containing protein [Kosmotogaceae bacterium]